MKKFISFLLLFWFVQAFPQTNIVIEDPADRLSEELLTEVASSLETRGLLYTTVVDFQNKCEYAFVLVTPADNQLLMTVSDCRQVVLGEKELSPGVFSTTDKEAGFLISFAIWEILQNPQEDLAASDDREEVAVPDTNPDDSPGFPPLANEHHSRYYFSPSAYNLRKNEFYYNTLNFVVHDIQYGFTDNFSFGLGSSVAFLPIYATPKLSFELGEKHHLAIGDLFAYGSWGINEYMNLAYGAYTYGSLRKNVTIGAGFMSTNFSGVEGLNNRPVISLAATTDFGRRLFFVTEHYFIPRTTALDGYREQIIGQDDWGYPIYDYQYITYPMKTFTALGFLGVRFVSKRKNTTAFQFGVGYLTNVYNFSHSELQQEPYNLYEFYAPAWIADPDFFLIPTMNFTYKFGQPID